MARGGRGTGGDGRGAGAPVPRIDWHGIEVRAQAFANEWAGETYERGESQSFWTAFLEVFGIHRRRSGAMFEYAIRKLSGKTGFIDLFWPGRLVVEQKSAGRDLRKAGDQAFDYLDALPDHEQPRFVIACDFATFEVLDRDTGGFSSFTLAQLPAKVQIFRPLVGETSRPPAEENPVNRDAAEEMATLHNELEKSGYTGHDLELMLVRLVFCLFADDALIFERGAFQRYLIERTDADGSDLGPRLSRIFGVLNTPDDRRQTTLDPELRALPYINGGLFAEPLRDMPDFIATTRRQLIRAARLDWSTVSPAFFGSMFQGVMDPSERRSLGAHYTSEKNILRVIQPLFLDALYAEFARVRDSPSRLRAFHARLATINVLDPACGCGNFLVITFRDLRRLEHKVGKLLFAGTGAVVWSASMRPGFPRLDQKNDIGGSEVQAMCGQIARYFHGGWGWPVSVRVGSRR